MHWPLKSWVGRYADHQFTDPAPASFAFMLSKNGYLLGADGPWRPHVMPFIAYDQLTKWAARFKGSPILAPPPDRCERASAAAGEFRC